jgi:hypothetical protein
LSTEFGKAYEVLGVKPGVSARELKAAHRDLAKVWHPDRFLHDPRLQEKAQEKLKELNEAYEQLISGKVPRPARTEPAPRQPYEPAPQRRSNVVLLALFIFIVGFAITIRVSLQDHPEPSTVQTQQQPPEQNTDKIASASRNKNRDSQQVEEPVQPADAPMPNIAPVALAAVTVMIDPESGLLATPNCPLRSKMTYPTGNEPRGQCNVSHAPPPKDSAIKSLAKRVRSLE